MFCTYIVYNSILLFTIIFSVLIQRSCNKTSEYGFRTLLFLTQAIPACLRKGIGTDYWNYKMLYDLYKYSSDEHEVGFQALGKWLNVCDAHFQFFVCFLAILALAPICYYVPKKNLSYFIIIYFFLLYLDIIGTSRQDISVAIIVCGIIALYHKHGNIKYFISALLAMVFHYSSMLYFPLIAFKRIKLSNKLILTITACVILVCSGFGVIEWVLNSPLFLDSPYGVYVGSDYIREANVGSGLGIMANILIPILFLLLYSKTSIHIEHADYFAVLAIIFIGSYLLASQIHIFGRLINVFIFVPAFLAHPVCKAISKKYCPLIFLGFFFMYLVLFEKAIADNQISLGSGLGVSPYMTIFD